jgi:hypothetical protein
MRSSTSVSRAVSPSGGAGGATGLGPASAKRSSSRLGTPGDRDAPEQRERRLRGPQPVLERGPEELSGEQRGESHARERGRVFQPCP